MTVTIFHTTCNWHLAWCLWLHSYCNMLFHWAKTFPFFWLPSLRRTVLTSCLGVEDWICHPLVNVIKDTSVVSCNIHYMLIYVNLDLAVWFSYCHLTLNCVIHTFTRPDSVSNCVLVLQCRWRRFKSVTGSISAGLRVLSCRASGISMETRGYMDYHLRSTQEWWR